MKTRTYKKTITIKLKLLSIALFLLLTTNLIFGQQIIRGKVYDKDSEQPIFGASILLLDETGEPSNTGAISNESGNFILEDVPIGRQFLQVQYLGYKSETLRNILISSGKEVIIEIPLLEEYNKLQDIVVTAVIKKDEPLNKLAVASARPFNLEQVNRFSGGRLDVSRLARNYAGVANADDSRNDIIIRGNSPLGLLWRLEGIPIPNPNHFAISGTTGGPVSAINTNLLKNSDFITGAFPSEYGNATAGVFDLGFRNGNSNKFETTFQMHATGGLEALFEGPINKKKGSSFILGYRYSITALEIIPIGTNAVPKYQDISFKFNLGKTKLGNIEIFGLGGESDIDFISDELNEDDIYATSDLDLYSTSKLGVLGLTHKIFTGKKSYLKTVIANTYSGNDVTQDNYKEVNQREVKYAALSVKDNINNFIISSVYNSKLNTKLTFRSGLLFEFQNVVSKIQNRHNLSPSNYRDIDGDGIPEWITVSDFDSNILLWQGYSQMKYRLSKKLTLNFGLHSQHFNNNNTNSIEPRSGIRWQITPDKSLSFAHGLHSQMQPIPILLHQKRNETTRLYENTNYSLDFTKSHHYILSYVWNFHKDWHFKTEAYYQDIFNVPVTKHSSSYSVLNEGANFNFVRKGNLENKGIAYNYGLEFTLEKFFTKNYYLFFTNSLFESKYKGSDGVLRNTAFNNNYVYNILAGKEFLFGKSNNNAIFINSKFTSAGGRYQTPINLQQTIANRGTPTYYEDRAYSERQSPYFRLDLKIGARVNMKKAKLSQEWSVDLLNITNHKNIFTNRYNSNTQKIDEIYQLGFFIDVLYRLQF